MNLCQINLRTSLRKFLRKSSTPRNKTRKQQRAGNSEISQKSSVLFFQILSYKTCRPIGKCAQCFSNTSTDWPTGMAPSARQTPTMDLGVVQSHLGQTFTITTGWRRLSVSPRHPFTATCKTR